MKKILHTIILFALCGSVVTLSSCDFETGSDYEPGFSSDTDLSSDADINSDTSVNSDSDDTELKFAPITEIRENYQQIIEELRTREFDNLDFSKTEFAFPEIDSLTELSNEPYISKSTQEIYDFFSASIDTLMPGKYSEEQKRNTIRFYDYYEEDPENPESHPPRPESFPTIEDYKLTDYAWPYIQNAECYMDMSGGVLHWYNNGDLKRWRGEESSSAMDPAQNMGNTIAFITDMNCTDKYELTNGEISIKDAAEFVNNYLATMNFSIYETPAKSKVFAVDVVDIGDGKYGYEFYISPEYNDVMFDHCEMLENWGGLFVSNDYESRYDGNLPGNIAMIETDKVFFFIQPAHMNVINEKKTYTSIITLENAAEIVSKFYSGHMDFSVKNVEVVYVPIESIVPCWKFLMNANGETYSTFVNMQTGEVYVYIQG